MSNDKAPAVAEAPAHKDVQRVADSPSTSTHVADAARHEQTSTAPSTEAAKIDQFKRNFAGAVDQNGEVQKNTASIYKQGDLGVSGVPGAPPGGTVGDSANTREKPLTSTGYSDSKQQYPTDQGDKNRQTDAIKPGETADQAEKREAKELREHMNDPKFAMTDQQKKLLDQSVTQIEGNKSADGSDRQPPLKPEQKAELLHQANRMFNETDRVEAQGLSPQDRNRAVTAMMYDSANPKAEAQGHNNTCNVTTAEKVRSYTEPEKQAKQFVDMYTNANGDHTVTMAKDAAHPDGKIQYDPNSLKGGTEARNALQQDTMGSGMRDQFTQGLNHLYVNDTSQRRQPPEFYTQGNPTGGQSDTGERLHKGSFDGEEVAKRTNSGRVVIDSNGKPVSESSPNMGVDEVSAEMKRLTGQSSTVGSADRFGFTDQAVKNINSTSDLDKAWKEANPDGKTTKPLIVALDTGSPMFGNSKGDGGGHVVVVSGQRTVDDGNGKSHTEYQMDNSWGDKSNGWVRSDQLVQSMDPNKSMQQISGGDGPVKPGDMPSDGPKGASQGGPNWSGSNDGSGLPNRSGDGVKPNTDNVSKDWLQHYQEQLKKQQEEDNKKAADAKLKADEEQLKREEELKRQQLKGQTPEVNPPNNGQPG